jgi:hypothetical protein
MVSLAISTLPCFVELTRDGESDLILVRLRKKSPAFSWDKDFRRGA